MQAFADLYTALDETNKTNEKVEALIQYFTRTTDADAAWALFFISGRRLKQLINGPKLRAWAVEAAGLPEWLFSESYDSVGDSAETIALLLQRSADSLNGWQPYGTPATPEAHLETLPERTSSDSSLSDWIENRIVPLRKMDDTTQRVEILSAWAELDGNARFVYNKLLTGGFRVGVSQLLLIRALSAVMKVHSEVIAHRLMGEWTPTPTFYRGLAVPETTDADASRPYPFFLAYPVEESPDALDKLLGKVDEFQAEWKWDGIRAQIIQRNDIVSIWSRGEELITERFPELAALAARLPKGTVIDGEILPWHFAQQTAGQADDGIGRVMPFAQLQRRIGRKTLSKKILSEVPVIFMAYDYLERDGIDQRELPMHKRRSALEELATQIADPRLILSPMVVADSWEQMFARRDSGREINVEGLMLKRKNAPYRVGRVRGDWWKWKVNPFTIDAVLIYAQRGTGKRASLYTDYTFAVWQDGILVPFAKAYSGLTDAEIREVDSYVRRNTLEKFGPVRTVKAEQVFELAFEGIQRSSRHKSGIAVRFPRILRWRKDKPASEADSIETIRVLLPPEGVAAELVEPISEDTK